jgi:hypothetical protein
VSRFSIRQCNPPDIDDNPEKKLANIQAVARGDGSQSGTGHHVAVWGQQPEAMAGQRCRPDGFEENGVLEVEWSPGVSIHQS